MPPSIKLVLYLMGFFCVFLTIVCRLEKRWAWPYGPLESVPQFADSTGYTLKLVPDALSAGFEFLGWARDIKGPTYQLTNAMLVSAARDIYVVMCVGKILNMPVNYALLLTPAQDGTGFYSVSHLSGAQMDISRHWSNQYVPTQNFQTLLAKHREWLQLNGVTARLFMVGKEYDEFRSLRNEHFRAMERAGIIFFTDATQEKFHFTTWGAARTAIKGYFWGMARQLSDGKFPRSA